MSKLEEAGKVVIEEARRLWAEDVIDPPRGSTMHGRELAIIDALIRSKDGLGWSWEEPYAGDSCYEWCGATAAWCWARAGLPLAIRKPSFSSTYRLDRWASYRPGNDGSPNPAPPAGAPRRLCLALDATSDSRAFLQSGPPMPGDILLVGDGRRPGAFGSHIALVEAFDLGKGWIDTISGNGTGILGSGSRGQGIVKARYWLGRYKPGYHACRLIRPAETDLV